MSQPIKTLVLALCLGAGACSGSLAKRDATAYQSDTRAVLTARNDQVKSCYDKALAQHPGTSGTVVVNFKIKAETGEVFDSQIDQNETTAPAELGQCILQTLDGLTIDPPDVNEGQATFRWDFNARA